MFQPHSGPVSGMWWPENRSCCVAKDVDLCWTYVGSSAETIERILASSDLAAIEVGPEQRADFLSEQVNGPVRPTCR